MKREGEICMENRLEVLRDHIDRLIIKGGADKLRVHISHMYGTARFCTMLAMKRNLDIELAATCGMLHDIWYMTGGGTTNHAARGAVLAKQILNDLSAYRDDEITVITAAISRHSDKIAVHELYDELLKDADVLDHCLYNADFPVAEWEKARYHALIAEFGLTFVK